MHIAVARYAWTARYWAIRARRSMIEFDASISYEIRSRDTKPIRKRYERRYGGLDVHE